MKSLNRQRNQATKKALSHKTRVDFRSLSHQILDFSNRGVPRIDFLHEILRMLIGFSGCDAVELWLREDDKFTQCYMTQKSEDSFKYNIALSLESVDGVTIPDLKESSIINSLRLDIIQGRFNPSLPVFTTNGSFWTGDIKQSLKLLRRSEEQEHDDDSIIDGDYTSLALVPLVVGEENFGVLQLASIQDNYFSEKKIELYERLTATLAIAMVSQRTQAALRERVKELTCLYKIAQISERKYLSLEEILEYIVGFLPPGWQYPEITSSRIVLDGRTYSTPEFKDGGQKQIADIIVNGEPRGIVEVLYSEIKPEIDEGPFIKEERNLINAIAKQLALVVEQREAEKDSLRLQEQLRHADRLATIGQLVAGVAHELNEPLGNILGFAQLAQKSQDLSTQLTHDIEEIVNASIHAREVIKKLMLFARQMPHKITQVDLNKVVNDGLSFLESRCTKAGIEVVRLLSPNLPKITGDEVQLNQVLVNLVVNSIQAMAEGGRLTIKTQTDNGNVLLTVEDKGIGISEEDIKRIFIPFFTTKEVDEGTGLGLAVVHGIVMSHKGSIKVKSKVNQGTRFVIQLPIRPTKKGEVNRSGSIIK